jgi:methyl-accepting chemotaxis protein/sigma-B regulation protein RsbU (phosphoserine phosphatase)
MQKILKTIFSAPSIRLNTLVVIEIVMLLLVSLGGLFYFSRQALVEESKMDAEQCLEGTIQQVDNVMMTIEQTAGNIYYSLLDHLDQPEIMNTYCLRLVESNPNILGCVIAFQPNYFPGQERFLRYVHRKKYNSPETLMSEETPNINYPQQKWYAETMKACRPAWIDPGQNHIQRLEPIITYCLPIIDKSGECVGVMAVGLSVNLLSQIVLESKPSPNSYNTLLSKDGSYIIHPNREKLAGQNVFEQPDVAESPSAVQAARAMVEGKSGNMSFEKDHFTWYLFYKPFVRKTGPGQSQNTLNWSIATIYPKEDIFGEYNHLVLDVLGIVVIALLVFYLLCKKIIRNQLKPLIYLTESAERIADGHFDESIPNVKRNDEVGKFYKHFQMMQKSLAADVARQEEQRATIQEHHDRLERMYHQIEDDNQVKATFLHNVTNRMIVPAESINKSVTALCDNYENITLEEADKEISNIKQQSLNILELLSHKFDVPTIKTGKERRHE